MGETAKLGSHGEEKASRSYARLLVDRYGARAIIPKLGDTAALNLRKP